MVFKNESNGRVSYSLCMSRKNQDGTYTNYFVSCRFRNGVNLENRTKIKNFAGWVDGYKDNQNRSQIYVFINEFEIDNTISQPNPQPTSNVQKMAEALDAEISLPSDYDLPF